MGGAACPLHDAGNDRPIERGSDLQAARRGSLTPPAKPAGERESDAALTPRPGTRSPKSRSEREPAHEASGPSPAKPMVRILFPPAGSPVRTWLSGAVRKIAGQGRSAMAR